MTQPQPSIGGTNPSPKGRTVEYAGKMVRGILILLLIFRSSPADLRDLSGHFAAGALCRPAHPAELVHPAGRRPVLPFQHHSLYRYSGDRECASQPQGSSVDFSICQLAHLSVLGRMFFLMDSIFRKFMEASLPLPRKTAAVSAPPWSVADCRVSAPSLLQSVLNWLWAADAFVWQLPLDWIFGVLILALSGIFSPTEANYRRSTTRPYEQAEKRRQRSGKKARVNSLYF